MQMKVKDEGGRIQCRDCLKCGAGLEPYPRCGEKTVFDLKNFNQVCKPCKDGHFKGTPGEVPNDLQCKPCDQVKCRENFEEIYPCTKKRPALCSDSCKKGFEKDNSGNCIKVSILYFKKFFETFFLSLAFFPHQFPTILNSCDCISECKTFNNS